MRDAADELMSTPTVCPHCGFEGTIAGPYHDCKGGRCTCGKGGRCHYHRHTPTLWERFVLWLNWRTRRLDRWAGRDPNRENV